VIVATLVPDGTLTGYLHRYAAKFAHLRLFFSVSRGCPDACTYEEPKEVKKRK
jgi:hypothetical protein